MLSLIPVNEHSQSIPAALLTEASPTRRLVLRALEAGDAYLRSRMPFPLQICFWNKKNSPTPKRRGRIADKKSDSIPV